MKVVVLFGVKNSREKDSVESWVDNWLEKLPMNTEVDWYVLEESKVEEGIKKVLEGI